MHARFKLAQWMRWHKFTQCGLSHTMDIDQGAISRWLAGKAVPKWRVMLELSRRTDGYVAVGDWALPDDGAPIELIGAALKAEP